MITRVQSKERQPSRPADAFLIVDRPRHIHMKSKAEVNWKVNTTSREGGTFEITREGREGKEEDEEGSFPPRTGRESVT